MTNINRLHVSASECLPPWILQTKGMPTRESGQLSQYSDSLRAGRSGDRIPMQARFFPPVQTGPGSHPAFCTMSTGSFPGVKRPGRDVDRLPPSGTQVKERIEVHTRSFQQYHLQTFVDDIIKKFVASDGNVYVSINICMCVYIYIYIYITVRHKKLLAVPSVNMCK